MKGDTVLLHDNILHPDLAVYAIANTADNVNVMTAVIHFIALLFFLHNNKDS